MEKEKKQIYKKWWFWLIVILVIFVIGSGANTNNTSNNNVANNSNINETNINTNEETTAEENKNNNTNATTPTDMELMSYAQLVLDDNLNNPKYSRSTSDYKFIQTNLRYKIEGTVTVNSTSNKFYMIIEFTDETYKNYDLISLQVGNETIYKK